MLKVEIFDDSGRIIEPITYKSKTYLPAVLGREYSIRITNQSSQRKLAVVSIDGLSVINGEDASYSSGGYILDGHSYGIIKGWRRGLDEVAAFTFGSAEGSYAAQTGRPRNVGVIAVACFSEKIRMASMKTCLLPRNTCECETLTSGGIRGQSCGTGYGNIKEDRVTEATFERRSSSPDITYVMYYDTVDSLIAKGVPLDIIRVGNPNPFPAERSSCYCPPPRAA